MCSGKISGDGLFTERVHHFFKQQLGFQKALLTTSCTDALEMAALLPEYATNNGHLFDFLCRSLAERTVLIAYLKQRGIWAVFHYLPLYKSPYYAAQHDGWALPWAGHYADHRAGRLVRLPLFYELSAADQQRVVAEVLAFYRRR